ncbi:GPI-linked NAD(P)(+)--arginine ADP-ribosyltransferase 1-like [Elgaria multicarinata webbii]|uniref:GPI-linked NAD(P)(+)--arginine ADP-ribosyltransferase 1-like n=1 Tax=Elgaria multicarinata webbii TaxID=159646 RepID=UPI002FCCEEB1
MGEFTGDHQVFCLKNIPLSMVPNSFDDQYNGCMSAVETGLKDPTHTDFASKADYIAIWEKATSRWDEKKSSLLTLPSNFTPEHGIAVMAYTFNGSLCRDFSEAVREGGESSKYYHNYFNFKSFHFLLTKALQFLRTSQTACYIVYRGIRGINFTVSDLQQPVRFGQFASSSLRKSVAQGFGNDTFFTIKTCLGVNIMGFSFHPEQKEILIPPYETFKVISSRKEKNTTYIELQSYGNYSNFNCGYKSAAAGLNHLSLSLATPFLL